MIRFSLDKWNSSKKWINWFCKYLWNRTVCHIVCIKQLIENKSIYVWDVVLNLLFTKMMEFASETLASIQWGFRSTICLSPLSCNLLISSLHGKGASIKRKYDDLYFTIKMDFIWKLWHCFKNKRPKRWSIFCKKSRNHLKSLAHLKSSICCWRQVKSTW